MENAGPFSHGVLASMGGIWRLGSASTFCFDLEWCPDGMGVYGVMYNPAL